MKTLKLSAVFLVSQVLAVTLANPAIWDREPQTCNEESEPWNEDEDEQLLMSPSKIKADTIAIVLALPSYEYQYMEDSFDFNEAEAYASKDKNQPIVDMTDATIDNLLSLSISLIGIIQTFQTAEIYPSNFDLTNIFYMLDLQVVAYRGLVYKIQNKKSMRAKMIGLLKSAIKSVMKMTNEENRAEYTEIYNDFFKLINQWETDSSPIDYFKLYSIFGDESDVMYDPDAEDQ